MFWHSVFIQFACKSRISRALMLYFGHVLVLCAGICRWAPAGQASPMPPPPPLPAWWLITYVSLRRWPHECLDKIQQPELTT